MGNRFFRNIAFLIFILFFYQANAQDSVSKAPLVGVWELTNVAVEQGGEAVRPQNTTLKVFDSNGTLSQVIVTDKGSFILQRGKYEIVDKTHFKDIILEDSRKNSSNLGKNYLIEYHFTTEGNNKLLSLEGALEDEKGVKTMHWKELWRKVDILPN